MQQEQLVQIIKVAVKVAFTKCNRMQVKAPTEATLDAENNRKMSLDLSAWIRANQENKGKRIHSYILCKSK